VGPGPNDELRSGKTTNPEGFKQYVEKLTSALTKLPDYRGTVYRAATNKKELLDQLKPGQTYTDKGFVSTHKDKEGLQLPYASKLITFAINSKTGKDVTPLSSYVNEVTFRPNTSFKVTKVVHTPPTDKDHPESENYMVHMDEMEKPDEPRLTMPLRKVWSEEARASALAARLIANARRRAERSRTSGPTRPPYVPADAPAKPYTSPGAAREGDWFNKETGELYSAPQANPSVRAARGTAQAQHEAREERRTASRERHARELYQHGVATHVDRYGEQPTAIERQHLMSRAQASATPERLSRNDFLTMTARVRSFDNPHSTTYTGRTRPGGVPAPPNRPAPSTPRQFLSVHAESVDAESVDAGMASPSSDRHEPSTPVPPEFAAKGLYSTQVKSYNDVMGQKHGAGVIPSPVELDRIMSGGLTGGTRLDASDNYGQPIVNWHASNLRDANGKIAIQSITRTFKKHANGRFEVHHDYFRVHENAQGDGIGKKVIGGQMALYRKLGVDDITVHANIDIGTYAWAKYGFLPSATEWNRLRRAYKSGVEWAQITPEQHQALAAILDNPDPHAMWAFADTKIVDRRNEGMGEKAPSVGKQNILAGGSWQGQLVLNNEIQSKRFDDYVSSAGKPKVK
jgi:GNAT superfamily N-acetyltransferase